MNRNRWLVIGLASASLLVGCGGDDDGSNPPPPFCPADAPDPTQQTEPCCAREDNSDNLDDFVLRVSAISLSAPASLASAVIGSVLNHSLDIEGMNWLVRVQGAETGGGTVDISTGVGIRDSDGTNSTYHFYDHATQSPAIPGGRVEWEPASATGTITGNDVSTGETNQTFIVPVFNEQALPSLVLDLELPLRNLTLNNMTLSADRSCVGERTCTETPSGLYCTGYDTMDADVTTYIEINDAEAAPVTVAPLDHTLCALLAGTSNTTGCTTTTSCCGDLGARGAWSYPPDSLCDAGGCSTNMVGMTDVCDPATDCNAWQVQGGFSAQGVALTP